MLTVKTEFGDRVVYSMSQSLTPDEVESFRACVDEVGSVLREEFKDDCDDFSDF